VLAAKIARLPVLPGDARPPPARADRPVPNPSKADAAKLGGAIPQPHGPDRDGVKHERESIRIMLTHDEAEQLRVLLNEWIGEGFTVSAPRLDFARTLVTEIEQRTGRTVTT
jgi:hypothetical protein